MSGEWQRAVINPVHESLEEGYAEYAARARGQIVRVRAVDKVAFSEWRKRGCDATKFYVVHPEDVLRVAPWRGGDSSAVCEHEILTD